MTDIRIRAICIAAVACLTAAHTVGARAQDYPTRPVRVLVGFPAGGGADILTRIVAEALQGRLGQPFVVENRPGASTNIATEAVVRAEPDGYTLLATTTSNLLNGALYPDLKHDFIRDIAPVASVSVQPLVLTATASLPVKSVPELVAYAKANPGKLNAGHFGVGTISHLALEAFKQATGADVHSVPYRGSPPMITDLIGDRIQVAFDNIPGVIGHVKSGTLRALAVTTPMRSPTLPDVPVLADHVPGYAAVTVAGIGAPKATPSTIVAKLNGAINAGLAEPRTKARLVELGAAIRIGTPDDFAALITRETERWTKVIKTSGIKVK